MKQAENPELGKILNTPVKDLPGYSFLVLDSGSKLNNMSVLEILMNTRFQYTNKYLSVSADEKKVIGYFAYRAKDDIVTTFVMFSFLGIHQRDNKTLLNDVITRLKVLLPKRIEWTVSKENITAIAFYDSVIKNIPCGSKTLIPYGYKYIIEDSKK
jgi:hypothetical protein